MFSTSAASVQQNASRVALVAAGLLLASVQRSIAQAPTTNATSWEFRISSGNFVPTGNQRNVVEEGQVTAAQLSWLVTRNVALTGSFAWARSRDLTTSTTPKLDVFTSDLGVESRPATWFASAPVAVSPFIGIGAGMRTYNSRIAGVAAAHTAVGYASIGGELGIGRVGVRLEVRDYVGNARFAGTESGLRNDVVVSAALRFNRQPTRN